MKLAKVEYQNIFNKNKSLKQEIELIKKQNQIEKQKPEKIEVTIKKENIRK